MGGCVKLVGVLVCCLVGNYRWDGERDGRGVTISG